jgi:hypothetical protein
MMKLPLSERIILKVWEFFYYVTWPLDELILKIEAWVKKEES